jgi:hypothetical protein
MGIGASDDIGRMLAEAGSDAIVYHAIISRAVDYFYAETKRLIDVVGRAGVVG